MNIIFSTNNNKRTFEGREDEPLGGAWYSYLSLAKELVKYGHKVYSFHNTPWTDSQGVYVDGVKMLHRKWLKEFLKDIEVDIYIGEREMPILRKRYNIKKVFYHLHNTPMAEHPSKLIEWLRLGSIDKVIFVSQWHRNLAKAIPDDQCYVIPNGTHIYPVKGAKKKNRLIWASNPTRGLHILATKIFPLVKERIPDIELHVAGDFKIYNNGPGEAYKKNQISYGYLKNILGVVYHGILNQRQLAQFYHEGTLLVYPLTNRSETGSIVAVQAMSYLTPIIARDRCVFPELVIRKGCRGILIMDNRELNIKTWVYSICSTLYDIELYRMMQENCKKWRDAYTWSSIGKKVNDDFMEWMKCSK